MTAFESLLAGVAAALSSGTPVSTAILTDEAEPIADNVTEAIVVVLGDAVPQQLGGITGNPVDWQTEIQVRCMARATGESARPAASALAAAAYARLAAAPSVGVEGAYIGEPTIRWEAEKSATRLALCTLIYTVQHRTTSLTLE